MAKPWQIAKNMWDAGGWQRGAVTAGGLGLGALGYFLKRRYQNQQRAHEQQMRDYYDKLNNMNQSYDPSDSGLSAMQAQIEARDANIESAMAALGDMYAGREGMYDDYADASYDLAKGYLDDEKGKAGRELRFALARAGLGAGSVDIDKHAELENRYLSGLSRARDAADTAASNLRGQDMAQKQSLMGLAAGGMADGSTLAQMYSPPDSFAAQVPSANLGNTFVGLVDYIGATRNPFRMGGGLGAGYARPDQAGGTQYQGTVVS